jgi:MFS family permease
MNFVIIPALIGPLLGPTIGGLIVHWLPWRTIFLLNLPFGLFGLWLVRQYMPDYRNETPSPLDGRGFLLFGGAIALFSYVLEIFGEHRLPLTPIALLFFTAVGMLLLYAWHERHTELPVIKLALFRIRTFNIAVLGGIITRLGVGGMPFLLPLLYQIGMGYPAWQAGLLTMPQALAAITMKVLSQGILERFGHRQVLIANTVCFGLTLSIFSLIGPGTPLWVILPLSFTQGFFSALQFTSMNTLVYADIQDQQASMANSIALTAQMMSWSFGTAIASLLTAFYLGGMPQSDHPHFVGALHHSFLTMGAVTILSSLTFWRLRANDGNTVSNRPTTPEGESLETA